MEQNHSTPPPVQNEENPTQNREELSATISSLRNDVKDMAEELQLAISNRNAIVRQYKTRGRIITGMIIVTAMAFFWQVDINKRAWNTGYDKGIDEMRFEVEVSAQRNYNEGYKLGWAHAVNSLSTRTNNSAIIRGLERDFNTILMFLEDKKIKNNTYDKEETESYLDSSDSIGY